MTQRGGRSPMARSMKRLFWRSFDETAVLLADEMMWRRRLMQRHAAATPVVRPMWIRLPEYWRRREESASKEGRRRARASLFVSPLTDITPDWRVIFNVVPPYDGVGEVA